MFDNWCFVTFEIHEKRTKYTAARAGRVSAFEISGLGILGRRAFWGVFGACF
jgi:hypothetical protein